MGTSELTNEEIRAKAREEQEKIQAERAARQAEMMERNSALQESQRIASINAITKVQIGSRQDSLDKFTKELTDLQKKQTLLNAQKNVLDGRRADIVAALAKATAVNDGKSRVDEKGNIVTTELSQDEKDQIRNANKDQSEFASLTSNNNLQLEKVARDILKVQKQINRKQFDVDNLTANLKDPQTDNATED